MANLSDEVIRLIFLQIEQNRLQIQQEGIGKDYTNALRVSRAWLNAGQPSLWKDISLSNESFEFFIMGLSSFSLAPKPVKLIRSITIHLNYDIINVERLGIFLAVFATNLKSVVNLQTFSLITKMDGYLYGLSHVNGSYYIDHKTLAHVEWEGQQISAVLDQMPPSLEALQIETHHPGQLVPELHEPELCTSIRRLLPQLKHFRLYRLVNISDLFCDTLAPATNLQTLVLNTTSSDQMTWYICHKPDNIQHHSYCGGKRQIAAIKAALLEEKFPNIKKFVILSECAAWLEPGRIPRWNAITVQDFVQGSTSTIPYAGAPCKDGGYMVWARINKEEDMLFSGLRCLRQYLEGHPWVMSTNQTSFPQQFKHTDHAIRNGYEWQADENKGDDYKWEFDNTGDPDWKPYLVTDDEPGLRVLRMRELLTGRKALFPTVEYNLRMTG